MSASKDDLKLLCTDCLGRHTKTCDGRRAAETVADGVVIRAHSCCARLCDAHGFSTGDRDLCSICFTLPENA